MFTGLVETVGGLARRDRQGGGFRLRVDFTPDEPLVSGESVAVNGVCLTVSAADADGAAFDASSETASTTTLGTLPLHTPVNIERALRVGGRFGGHMVLGHVDGVARVGEAGDLRTSLRLLLSPDLLRFQVPKGSIAVDGVSLTVAEVLADGVRLVLIPETLGRTTLGRLRPGHRVNVETDILGKYVWRFLGSRNPQSPGLSEDLLRKAGF